MSDAPLKIWSGNALGYLALAFLLIFASLLPIEAPSDADPASIGDRIMVTGPFSPDILLVLTLAWLVRRPDHLSFLLLVAVFLVRDLLSGAPPGIGALAILAVAEILRAREEALRESSFLIEWAVVAAMLLGHTLFQILISAVLFLPTPPLAGMMLSVFFNIMIYPLIVFLLVWWFGMRKAAPGSLDESGRRV